MNGSASGVGASEVIHGVHSNNPLSKLKKYRFAIAIIVGIGGLAIGGVGLAGYFQVGALSNLSQVHALIMMTAGGGGGTLLLIIGVVGLVKNRQTSRDLEHDNSTPQFIQTINEEIIPSTDTQGGLVYGPSAWQVWGVEVLDEVPEAQVVYWNTNDPYFNEPYQDNYALLYIPGRIRINNEEKYLTLQTIIEINNPLFFNIDQIIIEEFGNRRAPGWTLISKKVIPNSSHQPYGSQKEMVEEQGGFHLPRILEVVILCSMIYAFTNEDPFDEKYTQCFEKVSGRSPVAIRYSAPRRINLTVSGTLSSTLGVAAVRKF